MKKIFTLILLSFLVITGAKADRITLADNLASSIETAIASAADGDTIMLKAGTYDISTTLDIPNKDLTIIGAGIAKTALSGANGTNVLLFNCNAGDKNLTIENLALNNAESGAIRIAGNSKTVTLKNCDISLNSATTGSAINIASTSASATLIHCLVGMNSATNSGGAIFTNGNLTLVNTIITKNNATTKGGGIYIGNTTAEVRIINSIIAGNTVNTTSANDIQDSGTAGYTLEMRYSAYGAGPALTDATTNLTGVDPTTILANDLPAGEAQTEGTQTLLYGSDFWYLDKDADNWKSLTATGTKTLSQLGGANANILSDNIMGYSFFIERFVTTHEDVVDPTDGKTSLREAITFMAAGFGQLGFPIIFSPATDGKAIVLKNESGYKTFAIGIEQVVTIHGNGADKTIIDGGDAVQIFNISLGGSGKAGGSLTMEGVTLQNGKGSIGGAIDNKGTLLLKNSVLKDNTATDGSGAIYNGASLTLINCALTDNTGGADGNGGAIYIGNSSAATLLMNTTITGNSAGGDGGGLYVESGSTATILNSIIVGNTVAEGSEGGDVYNAGNAISIRLAYSAYGDWDGANISDKIGYLSDLSASAVFADPGVSLALLKDSDVATKGTLVGIQNGDNTAGAFWYSVIERWMKFRANTNGAENVPGFETNYTVINNALDTDPASGYPQRNNDEEIYSMGAVLAVAEAETDPGVHHELIFIVDEGIRINPNVPAYSIADGNDYTFYMYMEEGNDDKKPYVTLNGQPVVINPTQDGTGWVYRIPAVYENKTIEIVLQDLVSNLNPEEAGVMIYSSVGALIVDVAQSTSVTIYNIAGQAVAQERVEGRTAFNLPKGVYIIKTDRGTTKAVVR
ncbi:hypothetical protein LJC43_07730 [Parabacteroides sp. OttesenSCG-928-G21]|nr:hypothetical protein [Parabacteroides sp. OttesenSCG-928-G21]